MSPEYVRRKHLNKGQSERNGISLRTYWEGVIKDCEVNKKSSNGHGPVDYAFTSIHTSRVVGIIEVKDKDLVQGVAQNAVQ
ncbi:10327_t:CDS:2, partial [Dentiscutata erythropus]